MSRGQFSNDKAQPPRPRLSRKLAKPTEAAVGCSVWFGNNQVLRLSLGHEKENRSGRYRACKM